MLIALSLLGLTTGCTSIVPLSAGVKAQTIPTATPSPSPTPSPTNPPVPPSATPLPTSTPTITPWPTPTAWSSPTPWSQPAAWMPAQTLPTLEPLPIAPGATAYASLAITPLSYAPPDGVDVFGSTILGWEYPAVLAADEYFDIKIKPLGSNNSVFVAWTKEREYELRPWSGWTGGVYTWQIGIIRGWIEGETKHFISDTGRDSQPMLIKWQAVGQGDGGTSGYAASSGKGGTSGGS